MQLYGEHLSIRHEKRLSGVQQELRSVRQDLENERDEISSLQETISTNWREMIELLNDNLRIIADDNLTDFGDHERVSVYRHYGEVFVPFARYSKNPDYALQGRSEYPSNEGCIGIAWREGRSLFDNLPDCRADADAYGLALRDNCGIPLVTSDAFRMKSRSYAAFAIEDRRGVRTAVIVFESTRTGVLRTEQLASLVASTESKRFAEFLERLTPERTSLAYAKNKGF